MITRIKNKALDSGFRSIILKLERLIYSSYYGKMYGQSIDLSFSSRLYGRRQMRIGRNVIIGERCRIECIVKHGNDIYDPILSIGDGTAMNDDIHIGCVGSIYIGKNVLMASKIYISDHNHGNYIGNRQSNPTSTPNSRRLVWKAVIIEDNVWIGEGVAILPGVTIGSGSIIGANSVVTKDIPKGCIAVGSPAKIIKKYNSVTEIWEKQ